MATARSLRAWRDLVPHSLLRLLQPEDRLAFGEGDPHPLPDRVRLFARERENVAQEGFALVHRGVPAVSPASLADSPAEGPAPGQRRPLAISHGR
jgi:hypothetical protein